MISARATLTHYGFTITSPLRAIQEVRSKIEAAKNPLDEATGLIHNIIGLEQKFDDIKTAINVTQEIVLTYIENDSYDEDLALSQAIKKAAAMRVSPNTSWCFAKSDTSTKRGETVSAVLDGIDTQVAVKADGTRKKGSGQILAVELYKKYVINVEVPASNKEFVQILINQLGMSKAGANTYAGNMKKQFAVELAAKHGV